MTGTAEPTTAADAGGAPAKRQTRQRAAVWKALSDTNEFRSAQELHQRLREGGDAVGLATVYRALQALAEDGDVDVLRTDDGEALYRRCSSGHHHHLICRSCRATIEVDAQPMEAWARQVAEQHGYAMLDHLVEVFGLCRDCRG
ncbi:MAG: transcriptional repressor [Kineosporiaceae bacterium]